MALTEPFDVLPDFPGWTTTFEPRYRQEQSRLASGRTILKELGSPLWRMIAQSKILTPNLLDYWRARLESLENGMATFRGYQLARTYPQAYPNGSWPTGVAFNGLTANLNTIGANRKSIRVGGLPVGFRLSVGDMLTIGGTDLHRVVEASVAAGGGLTPLFEIRPHLWPTVAVGSPLPVVWVYRPSCLMTVMPGTIRSDSSLSGRGSVSFEALEVR